VQLFLGGRGHLAAVAAKMQLFPEHSLQKGCYCKNSSIFAV
jgi:hypothetical protein